MFNGVVEIGKPELDPALVDLFRVSPAGMLLTRASDSKVVEVNPFFCDIVGYSREELVGRRTTDEIALWVDLQDRARLLQALRQRGRVSGIKAPIRSRSGELRMALFSVQIVFMGGVECVLSTVVDITEAHRAEVDRDAALAKLQTALASMSDAILICDAGGRVVDFNDAFVSFYRFGSKAECLQALDRFADLIEVRGDDGRPVPLDRWAVPGAMRGATASSVEVLLRRKDTGEEWSGSFSYGPIRDHAGGACGSVVSARDITEERKVQRELAREVDRSRALLRHASDGVHIIDLDGNLLDASEQFCSMLGYSRQELIGRNVREWDSGFSMQALRDAVQRKADAGRRHEFESRHRRRDGSEFDVEVSWHLVPVGDRRVVFKSSRDITERNRLTHELSQHRHFLQQLVDERTAELSTINSRLQASLAQAEAATRAKSAFLAMMSHEIRTPMNGVLGMAQLLRASGLSPAQCGMIDKIEASGQHLLSIINNILDLSKIEAGKLNLAPSDFGLDELVADLRSIVGERIAARGLDLRFELPARPYAFNGDRTRLAQALLNYLDNACKFTARGAIVLACRVEESTPAGTLVRFEVRDTGCGLTPEQAARVFDPFEQADNSTTREYGGTGLGLSITRGIAQLMGGETGVTSRTGEGSCFWMTARLAAAAAPRAVAAAGPGAAGERLRAQYAGARVLLVEDDPINREVARLFLEQAGLACDTAEDGREALRMAAETAYALILMDMQMPVMDGLQATAAIRALPGHAGTPILALTANAFSEDRARCLAAGMDDFLGKPFQATVLYGVLLRWLARGARAG